MGGHSLQRNDPPSSSGHDHALVPLLHRWASLERILGDVSGLGRRQLSAG